ncbi:MAG TPA: anti-sigma factor [Myxococcaceae bacterium]|nr:anti-sigma factor [Myxococcaceae bacterium]
MTLLLDYLEGELPAEQSERLQLHLSHCPPCVEFVEGYQQTPKLCRKALEAKMPEALSRSLSSFLREKLEPGSS